MFSSKAPGSQLDLRSIEEATFEPERKLEIIEDLEKKENHEYLVMTVCRNPVEKLLSVYNVMQDQRVT